MIKDSVLSSDYDQKLPEILQYFDDIYARTGRFNGGCGSYLFNGQEYVYSEAQKHKQILMYEAAKKATRVLEIGVYMGHSLAIMLAANNKLKVTAIDINGDLSLQATNLLKERYPDSEIDFINLDSIGGLINVENEKYDLFHIDGNHDVGHISLEYNRIKKMYSGDTFKIVFDDVEVSEDHFKNFIEEDFNIIDEHVSGWPSACKFYECVPINYPRSILI